MLLRVFVISLLLVNLSANALVLNETSPVITNTPLSKTKVLLASLNSIQLVAQRELTSLQGTSQAAYLQEKYQVAKVAQDECASLAQRGHVDQAVSKGLEAMTLYKAMLGAATLDDASVSERIMALKTTINRVILYLEKVESRVAQAEKLGYNITEIMNALLGVRQTLKNASAALEKLDLENAEALISTVRIELGKLDVKLSNLTNQIQSTRASQFVVAAKQRVAELRTTILVNTPKLSLAAASASNTAVNKAQYSLTAAETSYKEGKLNETIQNLASFSVKEQQAITILKNSGINVGTSTTP